MEIIPANVNDAGTIMITLEDGLLLALFKLMFVPIALVGLVVGVAATIVIIRND